METIVRWIHVSDWHVKAPADRDQKEVLTALTKDVGGIVSGPIIRGALFLPDFVVHTGDIAFSGKAREYSYANSFLSALLNAVKLPVEVLYVIPGNHDVDDDLAIPAQSLLDASDESSYSEAGRDWYDSLERRQTLLRRFRYFYAWVSKRVPPGQRANKDVPWYACRLQTASGVWVGILGLNSAMASRKDDEKAKRRMVLGRWQVSDAATSLDAAGKCDLRIALMHHPIGGLTACDEGQSKNCLQSCGIDILLRGHLHVPASILETNPDSTVATLAAGSSYEKRWTLNGYVLAEASLSSNTLRIWFRRWDPRISGFVADTGAYTNVQADGSCELPLRVQPPTAATPGPARVASFPFIPRNRLGLALPRSGLEGSGVFGGYVDRESHHEIADKIRYQLASEHMLENKYLFWHVDSRRLYYECLQEPLYTIARQSETTFKASVKSLVQHLLEQGGTSTYTFVSLGVGSGVKEKWLLEELLSQNSKVRVCLVLVDINSQMLQWAMNQFRRLCAPESVWVLSWHADFDRLPNIEKLLPSSDGPVVFLLLGGLFGNQRTESGFLKALSRSANGNSYLLTGIQTLDAIAGDKTLGGYGTEAAFRFAQVTLSKFDAQYGARRRTISAIATESPASDVSDAQTISIVTQSPQFGRVRLGFSRRYDRRKLADFFAAHECPVEWDSGDRLRSYWKVLVKLRNIG